MKKIKNKLIVSDFDGTLLTSGQEIPIKVRNAINEYISSGGIFVICTGRMLGSILPRVRELRLKGLVVAYQGSVVAEIESGKIIKCNCIKSELVAEICRFIEGLNYGINAYSGEVLYTDIPKDNPRLITYEKITGITAVSVIKPMSQYVLNNKLDCQKVSCIVSPDEREKLYEMLSARFGKLFDVTCSASVLVEVSPYGDNKGEALKYLAERFNIPLSSTVAIGDNLNDLSMILCAGTGVAVGNAVQALKDASDYVSLTNDECAVAEIIEKYGFE